MWELLLFLSISAYVYTGLRIGDRAIKSWENEDNDSLAAKTLFPFNANRGSVGDDGISLIDGLRGEFGDDYTYRILISIFWPLKMLWNIPGMLMFSGPQLIGQALGTLVGQRGDKSQDHLPDVGDDIPRLFGKLNAIDYEMRDLLVRRGIVMDEIEHQRTELGIVIETEQSLLDPPDIPLQLIGGDGRKEDSE